MLPGHCELVAARLKSKDDCDEFIMHCDAVGVITM